ncbi:MAG: D-glycero-beta-D-manno-heptose-7-phosphate kinase [Cyanobacteria bacterium QS_8_64_29]|nr:MAG: D-glycero-beta-D-manno-heptose-7-phosphate kinase [Cyanobacteria bacterium QS_8_64_29]
MASADAFASELRAAQERLSALLAAFSRVRVLVVGDLTLDEFVTGQVDRLSREAPVLILNHERTEQIPGGGANATYNLAQLGGQVAAVGLVGADSQGQALRQLLAAAGVDTSGILEARDRPTVTKTRIAGHARQSVTQQIVRLDRTAHHWPQPEVEAQIVAGIQHQRDAVDAVVCSDYGEGVLSDSAIMAALAHERTVVDAQSRLARYAGATLFTPNLPEAERAAGHAIADAGDLERAGQALLQLTQAQGLLITRGESGMSAFERSGAAWHLPALNRADVFDVTGAGDTVVAALTLALSAGASLWEAAVLGNLAASVVVRKFGTATATVAEMQAALAHYLDGDGR